jgi:UDP-N-acetylglucosamine:LPS N-acetylglucosamine transferase
MTDQDRTRRMGAAAKSLATPEATKKIVDSIESIQRS